MKKENKKIEVTKTGKTIEILYCQTCGESFMITSEAYNKVDHSTIKKSIEELHGKTCDDVLIRWLTKNTNKAYGTADMLQVKETTTKTETMTEVF